MGCGCGKPSCSSCGSLEIGSSCCGNVSPAVPLAASCNTSACQENHCETFINQQFYSSLKVANSWNVPDCGGSAVLYVAGIKAIAIGSNLWAVDYGYFEVIGFNADSQQITIQNNCVDGNAPEGSSVPACTEFTVVDPPLAPGDSNQPALFPYVAVDFTAPLNATCLLITVTTVNGLVVGKNVQIGSGTYRISAISDSTHITICNDGAGITPGTSVIAKNEANQYQYPIILIDANPCTNPTVTSGSLLVCADDVSQPLTGPTEGAVPVLIDVETGEVEFQFFPGQSRTCTSILCCLTIVSGFAGPYVITVADSSEFVVGDLAQIGSRTDRLTITAIPDATHIQGTIDPVPGATTDIDVGTSLCIADCCEILQAEIDDLAEDLSTNIQIDGQEDTTATSIGSGNTVFLGGIATISIPNPSATRTMRATYTMEVLFQGNAVNADAADLQVEFALLRGLGVPPTAIVGGVQSYSFGSAAKRPVTQMRVWTEVIAIAPGATAVINAQGRATWIGGASTELDDIVITVNIQSLAVVV